MKRNLLKITLIILLIGMVFYIVSCSMEKNKTIDMTGNNDMWKASLNMNIGYNNELVITLVSEDFEPPLEVIVDVLAKEKSVYNDKLKIEQDDFPNYGRYKSSFDSVKYIEKNYKDVSIVVSFNNETIIIPLDSIEIIE